MRTTRCAMAALIVILSVLTVLQAAPASEAAAAGAAHRRLYSSKAQQDAHNSIMNSHNGTRKLCEPEMCQACTLRMLDSKRAWDDCSMKCQKDYKTFGAEGDKEEKEVLLHLGIFLMVLLLIIGFLGGYALEVKHFHYLHEAGGHLLIGVFAGLVLLIFFGNQQLEVLDDTTEAGAHPGEGHTKRDNFLGGLEEAEQSELITVAQFDDNFFFIFLLPPIIFEAGYNMHRRKFFSNIGAVCVYAFIGTTVSTVVIAVFVWGAGQVSPLFSATADDEGFSVLESLIFGSLISATDPVTVLAIFGSMGADLDLYSIVFGESVMNDAVAIVLYRTLDIFNPVKCGDHCDVTGATIAAAFGSFAKIFLGSVLIGTLIALVSAMLYKHTSMYKEEFESLEMVLLILFPYMAWMLAESLQLSGIVAILFCGIVMAHYTTHNLHPRTEAFSRRFFKTVAFGCESFVFIYMGLAMFTFDQDWRWPIIIVSIIAMLVSRLFNVIPNTWLINCTRSKNNQISADFVKVMWFAGLRGAIAFALALKAAEDYKVRGVGPDAAAGAGPCILTITLVIVLFTVLTMGGAITDVLKHYDAFEKTDVLADVTQDKDMMEERDKSKLLLLDRSFLKPIFTWRYQAGTDPKDDPRWSSNGERGIELDQLSLTRSHSDSNLSSERSLESAGEMDLGDGEEDGEAAGLLSRHE